MPWAPIGYLAVSAPPLWWIVQTKPKGSLRLAILAIVGGIFIGGPAGLALEAYGDWRIIQKCTYPKAAAIAYQEMFQEQMRRTESRRNAELQTKRDVELEKRRDAIVWRGGLNTGVPPDVGSRSGVEWSGDDSTAGMPQGPVTQELERRPDVWRRSDGTETPSQPLPSPRSRPTRPTAPAPASDEPHESAWDSLRQGRQPPRKQMPRTPVEQRVPDYETGDTPSYDTPIGLDDFAEPLDADAAERRKEQEDFDAILEKERRFGQDDPGRRKSGKEGTW
ncbi:hypothetical protein CALCODRAFT_504611 [Calocera cornea HHB12733]|uniref:Uncharacterized protein n=1 Tax=Calocera cornea HHB12733 TaxID=1353952 RepID=A0A165CBS8_9BASI|nr:hypothetical protein CALCODRAFT_504611 [Calocera cornea HHB12733]